MAQPKKQPSKKPTKKSAEFQVTFVGIKDDEQAPDFAAYQLNAAGRPTRKLGRYNGKVLSVDFGNAEIVALGPNVEDIQTLPKESLTSYRVAQILDLWQEQGIVFPRDIWDRFHFHFSCVTGTVTKCYPWYWDLLDDIRLTPMFELAQAARIRPITAELNPHILYPITCQPLCDGIIEIYERHCCCHHIHIEIPPLLDRLRDILDVIPIPIPDPIPDPIPGPDPAPFAPRLLRSTARAIQRVNAPLDLSAVPPQNLHRDYLTLRTLPVDAARRYVLDHPYLYPLFCHCSVHKVGQTFIQPGGTFTFCYLDVHHHHHHSHCSTTYAYKVKQLINGVLTTVYDGLAAHEYFAAGGPADIKTYNPQAIPCADGPGDPPPHDGDDPFIMLEYIGQPGTFHFNFPDQTAVSQVGMLDPNDGTYTTSGIPDRPWGGGLGLRLWFSPELEPIVKYYRLKVFAVNDAGSPVGTPEVLNNSVTWDKLINGPGGGFEKAPEVLGPVPAGDVGGEQGLFKVPYWSNPNHRYLTGQFHQVWNTAQPTKFPDGKYMLVLEVFDGAGNRVKPNGAAGPGTAQNFDFQRWASAVDTDPVPFADLAHIFWVDNTPVGGDLVDLRKGPSINTDECQFMTGTASDTFAIGFRAYHIHGVEHAGNGDNNSFMWKYTIEWQRGLNGDDGMLGPAPSGGTNHTDVGETGGAVSSGSETFGNMLTDSSTGMLLNPPKCTFSVTLRVYSKHFTGKNRIPDYDYKETASFALEITS